MNDDLIARGRRNLEAFLLESCAAHPGDVIHRMMNRYGIFEPLPPSIRLHPSLPYFLGDEMFGAHPAMMLPLRTGSGEYVGVSTLYLGHDGFAPVVSPHQINLLFEHPGMFFALDEEAGPVVAVVRGLGQALSVRALLPLDACLCVVSSGEDLACFDWPHGTRELIVLCDDSTRTQAQKLAERASAAGIQVTACTPPTKGFTWLDEYLFRGAVPVDEIAAAKQSGYTPH